MRGFCFWRGILIPLVLFALGGWCLYTQTGWIPGRISGLVIYGMPAIALGCMLIAGGLALNLHHFWGHIEKAAVPIQAAGTFAFFVAIVCAFWLIVIVFVRYFP